MEQHNGALPEQDSERAEFKKQVQAGRRKADEENYDEAMNKVYYAWNKSTVGLRHCGHAGSQSDDLDPQ